MDEPALFRFADFTLDAARRVLLRDRAPVDLGNRAFDILLALVRRNGDLALKSELMDEVWPGIAVEENNLTTHMTTLRRALGDGIGGQRFILTIAGRGYRFVCPITTGHEPAGAPATTPADPLPPRPPAPVERHNLPSQASSFVGRDREVATIAAQLHERRLVTLTGPGGVGKTRVALAAAETLIDAFADGVWIVEFAPITDARLVSELTCRALGAPMDPGRPATDSATTHLRRRTALLLLDNCEHVLGGAAELAGAICRACPSVRILATSRERLGIAGEAVFQMPSLPVPAATAITAAQAIQSEAVRLYVARAADALGGFTLSDDDAPHVAAICRRLDGVALAIELAAARLTMLKPEEIAARLADQFALLRGGDRQALPRQQTMRATIEWSVNLLSLPEQVFFRRLSVFAGSFTLQAAQAVAEFDPIEPDAAFDLLAALVEKSLVVADRSSTATRYRLLQTTRQFGAEKLIAAGETIARRRMAEHLAGVYTEAERHWGTTPTETWLAAHGPDAENLRAAIKWAFSAEGDPPLGVALVAASGSLAEELSMQADLRRWTEAAMAHLDRARAPADAAWVLHWAGRHQTVFGAREVSATRLRTIALFRQAGDRLGLACALRTAALAIGRPTGMDSEAFTMMEEAVLLLRGLGPSKDLATALAHMGSLHSFNGEIAVAKRLNEEALEMRQRLGDRSGILASYINLAELAYAGGDMETAITYARDGSDEARRNNATTLLVQLLGNLAGYYLAIEDPAGACLAAFEALRLNRAQGFEDYAVLCLEHIAGAAAQIGKLTAAATLFGYTDAYYERTGQMRDALEQAGADRLHAVVSAASHAQAKEAGSRWTATMADAMALEIFLEFDTEAVDEATRISDTVA